MIREKHTVAAPKFAMEYTSDDLIEGCTVTPPFYSGRASVAMEYMRNEVRKGMAPLYRALGATEIKGETSRVGVVHELLAQHESDIIDLDLLESAILQDDRKYQLLLRIEDMKRRKKAVIAKATGNDENGVTYASNTM